MSGGTDTQTPDYCFVWYGGVSRIPRLFLQALYCMLGIGAFSKFLILLTEQFSCPLSRLECQSSTAQR